MTLTAQAMSVAMVSTHSGSAQSGSITLLVTVIGMAGCGWSCICHSGEAGSCTP